MEPSSPTAYSEVNPEERARTTDARATLANAYRSFVRSAAHLIARRIATGAITDRGTLDTEIVTIVSDGPYASDVAARFEALAYGQHQNASERLTGYPTLPDGSLDWKAITSFAMDHDIRAELQQLVGARQLTRITQSAPRVRIG